MTQRKQALTPEVAARLKEINDSARKSRAAVLDFDAAFPGLYAYGATFNNFANTDGYVSEYWGGTVRVTVSRLQSFKEQRLLDILEELESHFMIEFSSEDNAGQNMREFNASVAWGPEGTRRLSVRVEAIVLGDSEACHRIVVGEDVETVRRPKYKLVCN